MRLQTWPLRGPGGGGLVGPPGTSVMAGVGDGASDWDPGIRLEGMPGEEKVIKIKFCEG